MKGVNGPIEKALDLLKQCEYNTTLALAKILFPVKSMTYDFPNFGRTRCQKTLVFFNTFYHQKPTNSAGLHKIQNPKNFIQKLRRHTAETRYSRITVETTGYRPMPV